LHGAMTRTAEGNGYTLRNPPSGHRNESSNDRFGNHQTGCTKTTMNGDHGSGGERGGQLYPDLHDALLLVAGYHRRDQPLEIG
jgi:hypothetical protein